MIPKPILITGSNRSGTTWVGKIIASSERVFYVEEPFNRRTKKGSLIPCPFASHYHSVREEEAAQARNYLKYQMGQTYPWWLDIKAHPNPSQILRASKLSLNTIYRQIRGLRPLVKDPIAVLSAEWLYKEFDMDVVIMVRHPAAYVSSIKRVQWRMGLGMFLKQKHLMNSYLAPLAAQIESQNKNEDDLIGDAIMAWNIFYHVISIYQEKYPNWLIIRHEDLSLDPLNQFQNIFKKLSLPFSNKQRRVINQLCNEANPAEAENRIHQLERNSKANILNWQTRLTDEEKIRVKEQTYKIARIFYTDEELTS